MSDGGITNAERAVRERALLRAYHEDGDTRARDTLAEEMVPLARALAGRYTGRGEPIDDLVPPAVAEAIAAAGLYRE